LELRRVQETGGSFFISLPRNWAQRCGLSKGSIVAVIEREDGSVTVDPQDRLKKRVKVATISPSPYLGREITGKYLLGFDTIKVEGKNRLPPEVSKIARGTARRLIGLEIVEEDAYGIVLQCVLEPTSFPPEKVLRREYLFASDMHKDAITALIEGNGHLAGAIVERDDEVDRLYFLLVRLIRMAVLNPRLREKMSLPLIDCLDYRLVASYIESIADYSCKISEGVIEFSETSMPRDVLKLLHKLGDQSYAMHQNAMQAVFARALNLVGKVIKADKEATESFKDLDRLLAGKPSRVISYASSVAAALGRICSYSIDLADIAMPR
jgi:phosphate uptake regulator